MSWGWGVGMLDELRVRGYARWVEGDGGGMLDELRVREGGLVPVLIPEDRKYFGAVTK